VIKLPSDRLKKYREWAEKVRSLLEKNDEPSLNYLPAAGRWLTYHAEKLEEKEPRNYAKIQEEFFGLLNESANRLHLSYLIYLKKADTHKIGTKVRLDEILRYVHYYMTYVHPKFLKSKKHKEARKILESFWNQYFNELVEHRKRLEYYQIQWIVELAEQSEMLGKELPKKQFSKIEAEIAVRQESNLVLLEQLEKDLETWETQSVEFKQTSTSNHKLAEAIAGFATANQGRIYVGIGPEGTIEGVQGVNSQAGRDKQQLRIAHISKDIVKPPIRVKVLFIDTESGTVLRIDVPKGEEPVYFADYKPYVRDLSKTRKLEPSEVNNLYNRSFLVAQELGFTRKDEESLFENVYGTLFPLLKKARMRHEPGGLSPQWPGKYWLTTSEMLKIEELLTKYLRLIPGNIQQLWKEAKNKGPSIMGPGEVEADNVFFPFDLEKMFHAIEEEIEQRSKKMRTSPL